MTTYTLKQVADQLQVHTDTIKAIIKKGELSAAKINNQWRISEGDLQTYFKNRSIISRKSLKRAS